MRPLIPFRFLPPVALFAFAAHLSAQDLLGIESGGGFYRIDPRTGLTTHVGDTGIHGQLWTSLAQDSSGRLFSSYGFFDYPFQIYEIDRLTGHATFVLQTAFIGISSMAFGPNGLLYLTEDVSAPLGRPYRLFTLDLSSGAATELGDTGLLGITALDFDDQGRLWAFAYRTGLVELDPLTGAARDVNPTFQGPPDPPKSMVFGEDGALWMIDLAVWITDSTTGVPPMVAQMSYFSIFSGLEYVQGPTPPFSLWTTGETGGPMSVRVVGATPGGWVAVLLATGGGGPTAIPGGYPCAGTMLDLNSSLSPLRILRADAQGRVQIGPLQVPTSAAPTTHLQAVDQQTCRTSNHARIIF